MPDLTPTTVLTVHCRHCGGAVPVVMAGPEPACGFCEAPEPLPHETSVLVKSMRARVQGRGRKHRQLTERQVEQLQGLGSAFAVAMAACWLLLGGGGLFFSLNHDVPLWQFMFQAYTAAEPVDELVARWWMLIMLCTGLTGSVALMGLATLHLRRLAVGALPLPPVSPGGQARCRCCAAELPAGGGVRRCEFCGADSLVVGERYRTMERDLDRALARLTREFDTSLGRRVDRASRVAAWGALLPALLPLVVPVAGLFIGVTLPVLWLLPGVLALVALLVWPMTRLNKVPPMDGPAAAD